MKLNFFRLTAAFAATLQLICCGDRFPSRYILELPQPPEAWVSILGEPHWRVEWLNPDGLMQSADIPPGSCMDIEIPVTWTNPVTAWPYWPKHYPMIPGAFKPAGALFPFDASGSRLRLSWEAGPDTVFYWELVFANNGNLSRSPANFDWPRFRELFKGTLGEDIREDPWLVDWRSTAERTISSGFKQTYLAAVKEPLVNVTIDEFPANGPWYGASPFAKPLLLKDGEVPSFLVRPEINVWVSNGGILRISENDGKISYKFTPGFPIVEKALNSIE